MTLSFVFVRSFGERLRHRLAWCRCFLGRACVVAGAGWPSWVQARPAPLPSSGPGLDLDAGAAGQRDDGNAGAGRRVLGKEFGVCGVNRLVVVHGGQEDIDFDDVGQFGAVGTKAMFEVH